MKRIALAIVLLIVTMYTNGQVQPRLVLPVGHTKPLNNIKISPNGNLLLTSSLDNTVRLFEVSSGKELSVIDRLTEEVNNIEFSIDGKLILIMSGNQVSIYDVTKGIKIRTIKRVDAAIFGVQKGDIFIAQDSLIQKINLYDSLKKTTLVKCKSNSVRALKLSIDSKYIISLSNSSVYVFDLYLNKIIFQFQSSKNDIDNVIISNDNCFLAISSDISIVKVWNLIEGNCIKSINIDIGSAIVFTPDSKSIIIRSLDDNFISFDKIHNLNGNEIIEFNNGENVLNWSSDGNYLITQEVKSLMDSDSVKINLYDFKNRKKIKTFQSNIGFIGKCDINNNGIIFCSSANNSKLVLINSSNESETKILGGVAYNFDKAFFSQDFEYFCLANWIEGSAKVFDTKRGTLSSSIDEKNGPLYSMKFNCENKKILFSKIDTSLISSLKKLSENLKLGSIKIDNDYQMDSLSKIIGEKCNLKLGQHDLLNNKDSYFNTVKNKSDLIQNYNNLISNSGQYYSIIYSDSAIIFNISNSSEKIKISGNFSDNLFSDYSLNDSLFVIPTLDSSVILYDIKNKRKISQIRCLYDSVYHTSFSNDTKFIVTISKSSGISLISTIDNKIFKQFNLYSINFSYAELTKNNKYVIGYSVENCSICVWDLETGKLYLYKKFNHKGILAISCNYDFTQFITIGDDFNIKYWDKIHDYPLYTFLELSGNDFLVYDKDYHFDGTSGAIEKLYFTCGLEVIDLAQLKDSLWIPGLAGKIMRGEKLLINDKPAPKLSDLNICDLTPIVEELPKDAKGNLVFQITPRNGGLGETEVYINDNLTYKYQPEQLIKSKNKEGKIIYLLNLSKDSITPFLSGSKGAVNPVLVKCKIKGASIYSRGAEVEMVTEKDPELPKLYAVFVGVNDYNNSQKESNDFLYRNLDYAAKDAGDLANMVEHSAHTLFKDSAFIYRLTGKPDTEPTKDNLKKVLAEIGAKAKANDILYIFFAGHGDIVKTKEEKNEIRFMLQGADKRNKNTGGFGVEELTDWCAPKNIKAQKRVFVFDACHSGQFVNETMAYAQGGGRGDEEEVRIRQLTSLKDKNGMMILAASSDNESAYEDPSLNQGVLTYHLLEAVKDSKDSTLQINKWFESTLDLVKEYATANNRKQTPETFGNGRFEIGNVNEQVRAAIQIGAPKPRVGNSVFIDATGKYPNLKKLINEHFKQSGSRGTFISANTNEKAYYAEGSVVFYDGGLKIIYTLYYGDTAIAEPFSMTDMKGLSEEDVVTKIIESMEGVIKEYIKKSKK